tara:strand:+ start:388 stop:585 length:198 start_codon:yes stop_codon:yes gene_type:complete
VPNKNYLRGVRLEREVVNLFKENGWEAVRTAGSHSPYDVVLIKHDKTVKKVLFVAFVQCKTKVTK